MTPIYTFDVETDPFLHGRIPEAFSCGLYNGEEYYEFWGKDCIERMMFKLQRMPAGLVYAHNGGRFDFFYIMRWILGSEMRIINGRIISAKMECSSGWHEFRDSFAIMPFALSKMKSGKDDDKLEIDITKLERKVRDKHREEILRYLKRDCISLWNRVSRFLETFGSKTLTIGSASMRELKKVHSFENLTAEDDADLRKNYYYGGRVECFQSGILKAKKGAKFKVYDVNSMYPYAMKSFLHPIGKPSDEGREIIDSTMFLSVTGYNRGAFPKVVKNRIMFDVPYGTFHVSRHEWDVAKEFGLFDLERVERCVNFEGSRMSTFADFVVKFYDLRIDARKLGDEILAMFYKFILNSAYGKFGQNPDNYKQYTITETGKDMTHDGWEADSLEFGNQFVVWSKPTTDTSRFNVATGASITGASRAILLRAIATAKNAIYCDTDSIICSDLPGANKDASQIGAWKLEAECDSAAIAGRKLYALFDGEKCVKQANKGVAVSAIDIWNICCGDTIQSIRDAPSFKLDGRTNFIRRRVRMTA